MQRLILLVVVIGAAACHESTSTPVSGGDAGLLPPGRACDANEQCQTGYCIEFLAGRACAANCAGDCGADMICKRADARNPSSASICVPAALHPSKLCAACDSDADCDLFGDLCLPRDGQLFCGLDCNATGACPEGYSCVGVRDGDGIEIARQCAPNIGSCTCSAETAGLVRPCTKVVVGVGTCVGEETCDSTAGWVSCNARTPVVEQCDNVDNDCDGGIDENPSGEPLEESCGYGPEPRRAECLGARICVDGSFDRCSADVPAEIDDVCNGLDDDCDGVVDEEALGSPDHCSTCDDVCPPGPGDTTAIRSCLADSDLHFCGPIKCDSVNYDVDGNEANGCEVTDDYRLNGDLVQLHDNWYSALSLSSSSLECYDGSRLTMCGARIPSDDREHVPENPAGPSTDYYVFHAVDHWDCSMNTWVCARFADDGGAVAPGIEVCLSDPVFDLFTAPTFAPARCTVASSVSATTVAVSSDVSNDAYLYVRVRSPVSGGAHYGGTYAVTAFDTAGNCPLGTVADPCNY